MNDPRLTRRGSLVRLGGFLATAVGAAGLKIETSEGAGPAAVASGAVNASSPARNVSGRIPRNVWCKSRSRRVTSTVDKPCGVV